MIKGFSYGKYRDSSTSAMVTATVEEVIRASTAWANDLGWVLVRSTDQSLVFDWGRWFRLWGGPEMLVFAEEQGKGTWVNFTASQAITVPGQVKDLARAARSFAQGVCCELSRLGAEVDAPWFDLTGPHPNRRRLKALTWCRRTMHWTLLAVLIPALAVAYYFVRDVGILYLVAIWILMLVCFMILVRYRMVGYRATFLLGGLSFVMVCLAGFTAVGVLHFTGHI